MKTFTREETDEFLSSEHGNLSEDFKNDFNKIFNEKVIDIKRAAFSKAVDKDRFKVQRLLQDRLNFYGTENDRTNLVKGMLFAKTGVVDQMLVEVFPQLTELLKEPPCKIQFGKEDVVVESLKEVMDKPAFCGESKNPFDNKENTNDLTHPQNGV